MCTEAGLTEGKKCSVCGETTVAQEEIPATGHTESDWIVDQQPAPGVEGSQHKECTVCRETLETAVIEALPEETDLETETESALKEETEPTPETKPDASTDAATDSDSTDESQGGCMGTIESSIVLLAMALILTGAVLIRKKETE